MNRTEATMDDLPELPFKLILSYLSPADRLKARAVSRDWRKRFDFKMETLCYSSRPSGFILGNSRLISGAYAKNFISSPRFEPFFDAFGESVLSGVKHLRLFALDLNLENGAPISQALNSFTQLEELGIFDLNNTRLDGQDSPIEFELNLPMLTAIQLEEVYGISKLTLDAPRLNKIKLTYCPSLKLDLVHAESVKCLLTGRMKLVPVEKMKSLEQLYCNENNYEQSGSAIGPTFLSDLPQLKAIHLDEGSDVLVLFEQKRQLRRADLKIHLYGLLLDGPRDPAIHFLSCYGENAFSSFAENQFGLADEIPLRDYLDYTCIEDFAPELAIRFVKRFTDLFKLLAFRPIQDVPRFLNLLKIFSNIVALEFYCVQPQELYDRLSEHCAIQSLSTRGALDYGFLFNLKKLVNFSTDRPIDVALIRRVLQEFPFLVRFAFQYRNKEVTVQVRHPKQFKILMDDEEKATVADVNAVIEFIEKQA